MSTNVKKNVTQQEDASPKKIQEPIYFASVYRYTCLGHVRASAGEKDDKVCRGIQYGLQHAAESHRTITRLEATKDFSILNGTAKDRQHVSPGMPSSINDALRTQAIVMNETTVKKSDEEWNEIDCYGITDVEVLVLQDTKTKKSQVTSVAPHCFVGNSVRDIQTKEGQMLSATIHLGPVEITLDSGVEQPHKNNAHVSKHEPQAPKNKNSPTREDSGGFTRPDMIEFSKKIGENIIKGASTLKDAVSEEFPSRMYNASQRVIGQMGNTVERTGKVAKSMYRVWFESDDDEQ